MSKHTTEAEEIKTQKVIKETRALLGPGGQKKDNWVFVVCLPTGSEP